MSKQAVTDIQKAINSLHDVTRDYTRSLNRIQIIGFADKECSISTSIVIGFDVDEYANVRFTMKLNNQPLFCTPMTSELQDLWCNLVESCMVEESNGKNREREEAIELFKKLSK